MTKTKSQKARARAMRRGGLSTIRSRGAVNGAAPIVGNRRKRQNRRRGASTRGLIQDLGGHLLGQPGKILGGLAEGVLGTVGGILGTRGVAAPTAYAGRFRSAQINTTTQHGQEQIASISVPAGTPAGTILLQGLIAPTEVGIRLRQNAQLWARTVFASFELEIISSNPTSISGNYTVAVDPDPTVSYESGPELPARLMALTSASKANAWADNATGAPLTKTLLFNRLDNRGITNAEIRQYADGQYLLATTTEYPEPAEYTVNVYWHVTFEQPNTVPLNETGGEVFTLNVAGADNWTVRDADPGFMKGYDSNGDPKLVWIGGNFPPAGVYNVLSGSLVIDANDPNLRDLLPQIIEVLDDGVVRLHIPPTRNPSNIGITAITSRPTLYTVNLRPSIFNKIGYALVSNTLRGKPNKHYEWAMNARKIRTDREISMRANKLLMDRLEQRLNSLSLRALTMISRNDTALTERVDALRNLDEVQDRVDSRDGRDDLRISTAETSTE